MENVQKVFDPACGGTQNIPLFLTEDKSNETEICNVDIMFVKNNRIKVIIEIEETNIKPTQILGKFMASALAKYYIHNLSNNEKILMSENVCFIQILDTKALKKTSRKIKQWKNIELAINEVLPTLQTNLKTYKLFYGNLSDINLNEISQFVLGEINN
jgi:hypothetical protein